VAGNQPVSQTRRSFLTSIGLLGLTRKAGRPIAGGFVNESHVLGHRLRDGAPFAAPTRTERRPVVIVGGGIAGLSAAWRLHRRGLDDIVLLEMAPEAGGNARWGRNDTSVYPWAAHYVPVPGPGATLVRELFEELGVLRNGEWDERQLCFAPQERLFIHGRWQEGLEPQVGPTRRDRDQFRRFDDVVAEARASGAFTIPMARGARAGPLDTLSMAGWLAREGFDSPWLRWTIDYACRDDYGARASDTSAWAGLHYFASREPEDPGPLTWPEGNGWLVERLLERVGGAVRTGTVVYRIERAGTRWRVLTPRVAYLADTVVFAAPTFLASHIVEGGPAAADFEYSPWVTANITLDRWPAERGFPVAWDNVIFDSPGLGYVVATHQSLRRYVPRTVWTYYWALCDGPAAVNRAWLLRQDYPSLRDRLLTDLARAHPDILACVTRVDIMRHGHAMIRPTVGFLSSAARLQAQGGGHRLFYANSDLSGLSLFEEAQYRGVEAADAALAQLGSG
jgi:glycine/D-amino acid oxidase-like deaminating enzyme